MAGRIDFRNVVSFEIKEAGVEWMFIGREPRGDGLRCVSGLVRFRRIDCAAKESPSKRFVRC